MTAITTEISLFDYYYDVNDTSFGLYRYRKIIVSRRQLWLGPERKQKDGDGAVHVRNARTLTH
jgi:hypothetical protein